MRAGVHDQYGPLEVFRLEELERPPEGRPDPRTDSRHSVTRCSERGRGTAGCGGYQPPASNASTRAAMALTASGGGATIAIVSLLAGVDAETARARLASAQEHVRPALST